jgi:hypothetical protein
MIVYTDIDQVIFNYAKRFAILAMEKFGIDIGEDFFNPVEADFMLYAQNTLKCTEEELLDTFYEADKETKLEPTLYTHLVLDFLSFHHRNRGLIRAVTARTTRSGAQAILESYVGPKIPIFCCSPQYKKHIVTSNSIYFEDGPEAAVSTALEHPTTAVIVPAWPWNESLTQTDSGFVKIPNIFRFNVDQMANVLTTFMLDRGFSSYSSWIPEKFRLQCSKSDIFKGSHYVA